MKEKEKMTWPTPMMMEWPFWRDGMTPEEYIEEDFYYQMCMGQEVPLEGYRPLWWQYENEEEEYKRNKMAVQKFISKYYDSLYEGGILNLIEDAKR